MTTKQAVAGGIGALLLAASVGTNVVLILRGESGPEEAAAPAVTADDLAAAKAETEKALADKDELAGKVIDLEKEVERQKMWAEAAWKSRQALADELTTIEGKLDEELARLGRPEREDDREAVTRARSFAVSGPSTLGSLFNALAKYSEERETYPVDLMELVGVYLEDESAIMDPSTGDVFEYESGVNATGGQYYIIKKADGQGLKCTKSPDGSSTMALLPPADPGSSQSPGSAIRDTYPDM